MRRGYTLVEMIVIMGVTPLILLAMTGLIRVLLKDVPINWKMTQQNTTILNLLDNIHSDINNATSLPASYGEYISDDQNLLIEQSGNVICYQQQDEQVTKVHLNGDSQNTEESGTWPLNDVKLSWLVLEQNDIGYAVEVRHYLEKLNGGKIEKKLENSHLYFSNLSLRKIR